MGDYLPTAFTYGILKGLALTATMSLFSIQFIDQLIIATVSAVIGVFGVLLGARMAGREARKNRQHLAPKLEDISRKVGADRRAQDNMDIRANPTDSVIDSSVERTTNDLG